MTRWNLVHCYIAQNCDGLNYGDNYSFVPNNRVQIATILDIQQNQLWKQQCQIYHWCAMWTGVIQCEVLNTFLDN